MVSGLRELGQGRTIALSTADVHVYDTGVPDGQPVVLLHGFLTNSATWRHVHAALAENHRLVLVDLPGSGRSPDPRTGDWTADRCTDMLAELFDVLSLASPVVIGSQMGGSLAAWLAARHPTRVSRLVVMAAGALGEEAGNLWLYRLLAMPVLGGVVARVFPRRLFAARWAAAHGPGFRPEPDAVVSYHRQLRMRGPAIARFGLGIRRSYGPSFDVLVGPLAGLRTPTLLLFGAEDRLVPPSTGRRFADLLPDSRLVVLPGCGDFPQEEKPDETVAEITAFLRAR
ncbi:pimeloyl-ACP methyl ester carboxylesterase [Micromonospora sp. Llam0]|uniref:alpha/beta fold hydrolase n=1 Tax=Micromonospora sp. Llam0 TaxID=2485143 RepID=UPI000F479781|nr:alpha/beta fold hydrolase [Micromonospora sp. Llam0]ROO50972.1 pimeloyl-ACP methyl ester carboxylesterase [Micromonospora sp. Llam0]